MNRDAHAPMPIIVGAPRSGTTLLRLMLDMSSELAIPPETGFLLAAREWGEGDCAREPFFRSITGYPPPAPAWNDFHIPADDFRRRLAELSPFSAAEGLRLFYRMYAARFGKARWGDKTPVYSRHLLELERMLPESRFVHLVRDGRDVAASLRRQWFSPGNDMRTQASFWNEAVTRARTQGARCRHYLEVRYESLVVSPETELRRICGFLDLRFEPAMLHWHERAPARLAEHLERRRADGTLVVSRESRMQQQAATMLPLDRGRTGAWRRELTPAEVAEFEAIAGDTLRSLGYALARDEEPRR